MATMHSKLIKMKWVMFWNILQVAGVDQGQVLRPGTYYIRYMGCFRTAMMHTN
jgi:hypothetical protein